MESEPVSDVETLSSVEPVCTEHSESQNLFCKSHNAAVCPKCLEEYHKDCETSQLEHEVFVQIEELSKLISRSSTVRNEVNENLSEIKQKQETVLEKFKENIKTTFQNLTEELIETAEKEFAKESQMLSDEQEMCGKLIQDGEVILQQLTELQDKLTLDKVESMRKANFISKQLDRCSLNLSAVTNENHTIKNINLQVTKKMNTALWPGHLAKAILLEADEESQEDVSHRSVKLQEKEQPSETSMPSFSSFELISMLKSAKASGDENIEGGEKEEIREMAGSGPKEEKADGTNFKHCVDGHRRTDSYNCWFTGIQFLEDGRLILADRNNNRLKLFSSEFDFIDSLPVAPSPFDIVQMKTGELAVSVPNLNRVNFHKVGDCLRASTCYIDTVQHCRGLAVCKDDLLVYCDFTFVSNACIKIYNSEKECILCVIPRDEGRYLDMIGTDYITADDQTGYMYFKLSRIGSDEVVCIDRFGKVIWRTLVRHWSHFPHGVATYNDNVILAIPGGHHVARLGECGHAWKTMYTLTELHFPTAISINKDKTKIAITNINPLFNVPENNVFNIYAIED